MVLTIRKINNIIKGKEPITDDQRYFSIFYSAICIHICFIAIYMAMDCVPLIIYNILIIPGILLLIKYDMKRENSVFGFGVIYWEVFFHDMLACIIIGWTFGFSLYNLGLIPVSFYISYMSKGFKHRIKTASIFAICNLVITLIVRVYVYINGPFLEYDKTVALGFSLFNCTISFLMVGFFSVLYILEIRNSEIILTRKNEELFYLANYDSLTNLYNRRRMEHFLNDTIINAGNGTKSFCVVLGDIDDFKKINDTYGHMCGDMVLVNLANIMQEAVQGDNIVCRWGGEEILMIIKEDLKTCVKIVDNIRKKIEKMNCICDNQLIDVTLTFGIENYKKGITIEKMIRNADTKLYEGKQKGKNCIVK